MTLTAPFLAASFALSIVSPDMSDKMLDELKAVCELRKRALGAGARPEDLVLFDEQYEIKQKGRMIVITERAAALMKVECGKMPTQMLKDAGESLAFVTSDFKKADQQLGKARSWIPETEALSLPGVKLYRVPQQIGDFVNLRELNLQNHMLTGLSFVLSKLLLLEVLNVENNALTHLPDWLAYMKSLKAFNCARNFLDLNEVDKLFSISDIEPNGLYAYPQKQLIAEA